MKTFLTILLMIFAIPAFAEPKFGEISVIDGGRDKDGAQLFGIDIKLEDGWKTYWRLAGQNGLDPVFDFSTSENLAEYEIHWPEPHLIGDEGIEAVGYDDDVRLVVSMVPKDVDQPIKLSLKMDVGVCEHVCAPVHREYEMELNSGYSIDGIGLKQVKSEAFDDGEFDLMSGVFGCGWIMVESEIGTDQNELPAGDYKTMGRLLPSEQASWEYEYAHALRIYNVSREGMTHYTKCN